MSPVQVNKFEEARSHRRMQWCSFWLLAGALITFIGVFVWSAMHQAIVPAGGSAALDAGLFWQLRSINRYLFPPPETRSRST